MKPISSLSRREFIAGIAASGGLAALGGRGALRAAGTPSGRREDAAPREGEPAARRKIRLGFDNFSIRAFGWKAPELIEYAASLRLDTVLLSDLHVFEDRSDRELREVKALAGDRGVAVQVGTGGICPTARRVNRDFGPPEEHLRLLIRVAKALGSTVARCYLGSADERRGEGGIYRHIRSTVEVLRKVRGEALDAGVKVAVENHAGDLQAWELVTLIEEAGKDFVGATVDSGNATWTLEDPLRNLEVLAPYAVSSGIRDSMVWEYEEGAMVQWTALGDGCVDLRVYVDLWERLCPDAPVQLEVISGFARPFPYLRKDFWPPYERVRAEDLAAFVALAKRGRAIEPFRPPEGVDRDEATRRYQKDELERSVRYARETLGLGVQ